MVGCVQSTTTATDYGSGGSGSGSGEFLTTIHTPRHTYDNAPTLAMGQKLKGEGEGKN